MQFEDLFLYLGWLLFIGVGFLYFRSLKKFIRGQSLYVGIKQQLENALEKQNTLSVENERLKIQEAQTETRFIAKEEQLNEQIGLLEKMEKQLKLEFQNIASGILKNNTDEFLKFASESLEKRTFEANSSFEKKSLEFKQFVEPLKQSLSKIEKSFEEVGKERVEHFTRLNEQIQNITDANEKLRKETSTLSSALRRPEVRGNWGEIQLRRVVELAGMSSYCDFDEQITVKSEDKLLRPDMLVKLPNKRDIVVDSKAVLDAYLDAIEAENEEQKAKSLERHAKNIKSRVKELSRKVYWSQFENSPEFVVLFIPNEALLQAAVEVDRKIIEEALEEKIIISTPTTFVALLKAVAYGWQQEQIALNAKQVIQQVKEFSDRFDSWLKKYSDLGTKLNQSVKTYNESVATFEGRVIPSIRKIKEIGFLEDNEIPEVKSVDLQTRSLEKDIKI